MGIMIIPFVMSLSDDIINAVPDSMREASLGMGATMNETIRKVLLPAALPGIVGGVLLAWRGDWTVLGDAADAAPVRLTPGEGVWWQNGGQALACAPAGDAGALLAVAFDSV